ncbi:MAG: hypothetical protein JO356_10565, partial [Acidobacteria bacterium]|nr:hypothetical protein [Acidobacteriota bacterium]
MRRPFTNLSVQRKLMLLTLAAAVFALAWACVGFALYQRATFRASTARQLTSIFDSLESPSATALVSHDGQRAQEILGTLRAEPSVAIARLYDKEGKVFATYARAGLGRQATVPELTGDGIRAEKHTLVLNRGLRLDGIDRGTILIVSDLPSNGLTLVDYLKIAFLTLTFSVLFTSLISSSMFRMFGEQIERSSHILAEERRVLE